MNSPVKRAARLAWPLLFWELIRSRTGEGRERAKARGVVMGRKPKLTHHQRQEAVARREAGESLMEIGRSYNVSHSTISRL